MDLNSKGILHSYSINVIAIRSNLVIIYILALSWYFAGPSVLMKLMKLSPHNLISTLPILNKI